jgi:hypothetical protein
MSRSTREAWWSKWRAFEFFPAAARPCLPRRSRQLARRWADPVPVVLVMVAFALISGATGTASSLTFSAGQSSGPNNHLTWHWTDLTDLTAISLATTSTVLLRRRIPKGVTRRPSLTHHPTRPWWKLFASAGRAEVTCRGVGSARE